MNENHSQSDERFEVHTGNVEIAHWDLKYSNKTQRITISMHRNSINLHIKPLNISTTIEGKDRWFKDINDYLKDIKKNHQLCLERQIMDDIRSKAGITTTTEARGEINQLIDEHNWEKAVSKTKDYHQSGYDAIVTDKFANKMIDTAKGFLRQGDLNQFYNQLSELEQLIPEKETIDDKSYEKIREQIRLERAHAGFVKQEYKLEDKKNLKFLADSFEEIDDKGLTLPQGYQFHTPPKNGKRKSSLSTSPTSESLDSSPDKKKQKLQQGSDISTRTFGQGVNSFFGRLSHRFDEQSRGGSGFDSEQKTILDYFSQIKK